MSADFSKATGYKFIEVAGCKINRQKYVEILYSNNE